MASGLSLDRRRLLVAVAIAATAIVVLYVVVPRIAGFDETWERIDDGEPGWLVAAAALEVLSFAGYVVLVRLVLADGHFAWRFSILLTLAGVAATRLFAAGGAGGIALTAWAVRRTGLPRHEVAARVTAFLVVLYSVFMVALVVGGIGLGTGLLPGPAPDALTWVPAAIGAVVIVATLALSRLSRVGAGVRLALRTARRRDPRLAGAVAWWGFDILTLWACLQAFGDPPQATPLVMAYFVGMLGNLLPLPGGVGGVDGAMIGALVAFGVVTGLAIVGVLAYRVLALWLPTVLGIPAYVGLVRDVRSGQATVPERPAAAPGATHGEVERVGAGAEDGRR
jgi:uncharacterized membrane protein YbhN (UPF0104 family)